MFISCAHCLRTRKTGQGKEQVIPSRKFRFVLYTYRGANQMLGGGLKLAMFAQFWKNYSAFESSRRDLCFGAIITLKENKFEKDIFLKGF